MGSAVNGSMDVQVVEYVWVFADGGAACVLCIVCGVWVFASLSENTLGAKGGAAMAGTVPHLTLLTTLEYV